MTNNLYEFRAYNSQTMYGWGSEHEAELYCESLNRNREINVYAWHQITDVDEIAKLDDGETGVNLSDELLAIKNDD